MPEQENKALDEQNLDEVFGGNKLDGIKSWGHKHSKALKIGGAIVGTAAAATTTGVLVHQHRKKNESTPKNDPSAEEFEFEGDDNNLFGSHEVQSSD